MTASPPTRDRYGQRRATGRLSRSVRQFVLSGWKGVDRWRETAGQLRFAGMSPLLPERTSWRVLGTELREARHRAGYTNADLCAKLGWSPAKVSRRETGVRSGSTIDLISFATACGVFGTDHPGDDRHSDRLLPALGHPGSHADRGLHSRTVHRIGPHRGRADGVAGANQVEEAVTSLRMGVPVVRFPRARARATHGCRWTAGHA